MMNKLIKLRSDTHWDGTMFSLQETRAKTLHFLFKIALARNVSSHSTSVDN